MTAQNFAAVHYPSASHNSRYKVLLSLLAARNWEVGRANQLSLPSPLVCSKGVSQLRNLTFTTFADQRLEDPLFNPVDADGLGRMSFNLQSFEAFLVLLKQHLYHSND